MTRRERTVRGQVSTEHLVQLFDDTDSLAETVAAFLYEGWKRDETLLVVARPENWAVVARRLAANGCPVKEASAARRLIVLDAATTLAAFLRNGRPVPERFEQVLGTLVARLCRESGKPLRIYGEMVDILAAQSDFVSATDLERLWNDLGTRCSIVLLCGLRLRALRRPAHGPPAARDLQRPRSRLRNAVRSARYVAPGGSRPGHGPLDLEITGRSGVQE